jgi:hypothetical protein
LHPSEKVSKEERLSVLAEKLDCKALPTTPFLPGFLPFYLAYYWRTVQVNIYSMKMRYSIIGVQYK